MSVKVFIGPNSFALKQALSEVKAGFIKQHGDLAVETIDGDEADFQKVKSAVQSVPFLSSSKLTIVYNLGSIKEPAEEIEGIINSIGDEEELLIVEPKPDKRSSYYKYLKKNTEVKEFNELDERALAAWAVEYSKEKGAKLSTSDANYLIQRAGTGQELLSNELKKLIDYDVNITRENIDSLTEASPQTTVFNLLDAAFSGNTKKAIEIYGEQRYQGEEPLKILGLIIWQLHLVALVDAAEGKSDSEIMQASGLKPFTLNKSKSIVRHMGRQKIRDTLNKLVELDKRMKSSLIDPDEALKDLIISIS